MHSEVHSWLPTAVIWKSSDFKLLKSLTVFRSKNIFSLHVFCFLPFFSLPFPPFPFISLPSPPPSSPLPLPLPSPKVRLLVFLCLWGCVQLLVSLLFTTLQSRGLSDTSADFYFACIALKYVGRRMGVSPW